MSEAAPEHPGYTFGPSALVTPANAVTVARLLAAPVYVLMLIAILFEEREMRERFGDEYAAYCRSVPRFLPLGARHGAEEQRQSV